MSLVRLLARHVGDMDYATLPMEVVEQAKRCILDCAGNMVAGRYTDKGRMLVEYASRWSAIPEATVVGGIKVSREKAAFANAAFSRMLDLDDGHRFAFGHPGGILVPSALAIGECVGASGMQLITALVAGYDVYGKLGRVINPSSYNERGFDATGVCGPVAVAAVAAKLYNLTEEKTADALGIAALQAGGIIEYQNDGTMGKVLCPGWSVSTGIKAADLADMGFSGPVEVFEGKKGFFQAFSNTHDAALLTEGLGKKYEILKNYFKLHACMRGLHCTVDAVLALRSAHELHRGNVQEITVFTSSFVERLNKPHPRTLVGAQCSLPFSVAIALKYGCIDQEHLVAGMNDPEIGEIEEIVKVVVDDDIQAFWTKHPENWAAAKVEIKTIKDEKFFEWVPVAVGEPERPILWKQLSEKFVRLVKGTDFESSTDSIIQSITAFEFLETAHDFTSFFQPR